MVVASEADSRFKDPFIKENKQQAAGRSKPKCDPSATNFVGLSECTQETNYNTLQKQWMDPFLSREMIVTIVV